MGGYDKTTPGRVVGAALVDNPTIAVRVGVDLIWADIELGGMPAVLAQVQAHLRPVRTAAAFKTFFFH